MTNLINEAKSNVGESIEKDENRENDESQKDGEQPKPPKLEKRKVTVHTWIDYRNGDFDFMVEVYRDLLMFGIIP